MVNTPIPHSLRSESLKAAKILQDFTMPSAKSGPDKIIPAGILVKAEGLAILTVVKVGFLVTARAGSGIVIAKLGNKKWSAPSAIGIAGLGGGFEIGAEVTDFVIILTRRSAVEAFSKGGNLTLGGNLTVAAGPLGRNIEGDVAVRSPAAVYTYSKTKGLFAGISIEGSYLIERKDANRKFYCQDVRASEILSGFVDAGNQCEKLYSILEHHEAMFEKVLEAKARQAATKGLHRTGSEVQKTKGSSTRLSVSSKYSHSATYRGSWADRDAADDDGDEMYFASKPLGVENRSAEKLKSTLNVEHLTQFQAERVSITRTSETAVPTTGSHTLSESNWEKPSICEALWSYEGQLPCDLSFKKGEIIEIRTSTNIQDDWWEGVGVNGKLGIFPANYVQLL